MRRRALRAAGRAAGKVAPPASAAYWLARASDDPVDAARSSVVRLGSLIPPTAADVVSGYIQGRILLGRDGASLNAFDWEFYPERSIITPETVRISKRLRALRRNSPLTVRFDRDFDEVIERTRRTTGTWVTSGVVRLYEELFEAGLASCVGAYDEGRLVGGLWGIRLGSSFGIMSVFHAAPHAGTIAQLASLEELGAGGRWDMIETGILNDHYARFGAIAVPADEFSLRVTRGLALPARAE